MVLKFPHSDKLTNDNDDAGSWSTCWGAKLYSYSCQIPAKTPHTYTDADRVVVEETPATCITKGSKTTAIKCTVPQCRAEIEGKRETVELDFVDHTYDESKAVVETKVRVIKDNKIFFIVISILFIRLVNHL